MSKKRKKRINHNIKHIKSHEFVQGKYEIIWKKPRGCQGMCSDPKDRKIWLNPNMDDLETLRVTLDESIHACLWPIDNDYVYDMSSSMADFLYKLGFRLEKRNFAK